jgi:hypothetical protein
VIVALASIGYLVVGVLLAAALYCRDVVDEEDAHFVAILWPFTLVVALFIGMGALARTLGDHCKSFWERRA